MLTNNRQSRSRSSRLALWVGVAGVGVGIVAGLLAGMQPLLLGVAFVAVAIVVYFFSSFEYAVLGLLILRSSLDIYSAQQLPAVFAVGLDALTLLYVTVMLLTGKKVHTDGFWWFFAGWIMLQSLWVILLPLGGLGLDASVLPDSIREWVRLFSWLMVYLLVMQLKDRLPPQKVISGLFFSLIIPLTVGLMQVGGKVRINGTLGHPNTFATFLLLFIGLTCWQLSQSKRKWPWLLLLGLLAFFFVGTKALFSLMMLAVFVLVLIAPKMSWLNLIGGILLFAVVIGLFASTEFGQQRLSSLSETPLLNPDIDISRAILLSQGDNNSFNWRIAQWTFLLQAWEKFPIFGYGLATCSYLTSLRAYAHNDYIRALAEGGVVGLVAFLIFLGAQATRIIQLLQKASRGSPQHDLSLILLALFLATLVGMITENIWSHTTLYFYWWTLLAVACWNWDKRNNLDTLESVGHS